MELKTVELTKQYGKKKAVYHMSVTLNAGVYGLLGANGAGKTTLMRLLCALQRPTEGRILLDGKNIEKLGEGYRNLLGYLPQGFGYYPDFRAIDFLRYIAALKLGRGIPEINHATGQILEAVPLQGDIYRMGHP
ncbi:MAG: ATP-binding cassette domain-containing protein, partial [Lachnospiraceae bacterium]|nr:ATP-binding cassette domain-containing protein [Lachnospiraceae bacterium]